MEVCVLWLFFMSFCGFQVALLGLDLLSALVTRLQDRFRAQLGTGKGQFYCFM